MKSRILGNSNLKVLAHGLGYMGFTQSYSPYTSD